MSDPRIKAQDSTPAHSILAEAVTSPLVSVIVPTFNQSSMLGEAIDSALDQRYSPLEVIVVDDGSTDDTDRVLGAYGQRIVTIRQENRGLPAARNAGLAAARGAYIVFLDSDDLLLPEKLQTQVPFLEQHPGVDVVYGDGFTLNAEGRLSSLEPFVVPLPSLDLTAFGARLLQRNLFAVHTATVRAACLPAPRPFDETLRAFEDWDLWIRLAALGSRFEYQDAKVAIYRRHAANTEGRDPRAFKVARAMICAKVVRQRLDAWLPGKVRKQHRLTHFGAILRTGSPEVIWSSLCTIVAPDGSFDPQGILELLVECSRIVSRAGSRMNPTTEHSESKVIRFRVSRR